MESACISLTLQVEVIATKNTVFKVGNLTEDFSRGSKG